MARNKLILLAIAAVIGLGTMLMMRMALHSQPTAVEAAATPPAPKVEVLVAGADLKMGQFLGASEMRWQEWAPEHVTEAFIRHDSDEGKALDGAVMRVAAKAGEPILHGQLVKPGERGFLAAVLDPGKRAVAVPITSVTGIAGFVFPGDHIDLILSHSARPADDSKVDQRRASVTVVKNVRVLALDQDTAPPAANTDAGGEKKQAKLASVVTIEVSPKEAEVVTLSLQLGTLSLSLRAMADATQVATAEGEDGKLHAVNIAYGQPQPALYTLDSEISQIIPGPENRTAVGGKIVQVLRGSRERQAQDFAQGSGPLSPMPGAAGSPPAGR